MLFFAIPGKIFVPMGVVYAVAGVIAAVILVLFFKNKSAKAAAEPVEVPTAAPVVAAPVPAVADGPAAPGSAGKLKLYDTPPKTAAMLMAIVADRLQKPINELRFISIKEVK